MQSESEQWVTRKGEVAGSCGKGAGGSGKVAERCGKVAESCGKGAAGCGKDGQYESDAGKYVDAGEAVARGEIPRSKEGK
jgi:hypothetical protein